MAGWWYFLAAFPFYSFLLARWLWRLGIWWRLLWQASRLELRLSPAHPDGAAGLGFLSTSLSGFSLFVFGVAAMFAAGLADLVVYEGASPLDYQWYVVALLVFLLILIAGPLLFFMPRLFEAKDQALLQYGGFASRQVQELERKWLEEKEGGASEDTGIGSQDFSTVSDFGALMDHVRETKVIPIELSDVIQFLVIALLPFLPVFATQIPIGEMLSLLLKTLG